MERNNDKKQQINLTSLLSRFKIKNIAINHIYLIEAYLSQIINKLLFLFKKFYSLFNIYII